MKSNYTDDKITIIIDQKDLQVIIENEYRWNGCKILDKEKLAEYLSENLIKPTESDDNGDYSFIEKAIEDLTWKAFSDGKDFVESLQE